MCNTPSSWLRSENTLIARGVALRFRISRHLTGPKAADIMGIYVQSLSVVESKKGHQKFQDSDGRLIIPEKILDTNPYGIFPLDADRKVTAEFREKFLKLAKPNAMKAQYDAAHQWVHEDMVRVELGLDTSKKPHQKIIKAWRQQTKQIEDGNEGNIVTAGKSAINVMRGDDGYIRFHRSGLAILRQEMMIDSRVK
jgi:hypothetical protein